MGPSTTQCAIAGHGSHEGPHPCGKHTVRACYVSRTCVGKKEVGRQVTRAGPREGRERWSTGFTIAALSRSRKGK